MNIKITFVLIALLAIATADACPVCKRNQPKILKGVVHGSGPESQWDYVIIAVVAAIVLVTLFFSVKWLIRPGEKSVLHIKRTVLNKE